ncbi:MAG: peptide ABC transporter substrate-binding protein [Rhodospirillaceae bacterium]
MSLLRRAFLALALAVTFASTASAQTLNRGGRGEPGSLDPHKANSQYEQALVLDLFEGLLAFNADGQPVPGIADSWAVSPDGRRYVFNLRPGLVWSDGTPLTAEHVVASFRRLLDPKTAAPGAAQMFVIKNARAVNTGQMPPSALGVTAAVGTVALELEAPVPYLPSLLAASFAVVVPPQAHASPDSWTRPGTIVGNGAFVLSQWEPQSHITLVRNEKYRDAANVKLARVIYHPAPDTTAAVARFRAGDFDMLMEFPSAETDRILAELKDEARLTPALLTYYLSLNTREPRLRDRRVRRALSLAIDRDTLVSKVVRGGALPAMSFVPPATANYTPPALDLDSAAYEIRLREARRLLAEAGYGPDNPLRLAYAHTANQELRRIAVVIAAMWKRAGVETSLLNTEGRVHFSNLRQGVFEVAFVAWLADFNDAANFLQVLDSASAASNYARYDNPTYDGLLRQAAQTTAMGERAKLLKDAEAMMLADQPVIPLYYGATRNLVSKRIAGWRGNPTDIHLSRYLSLAPAAN